MPANSFGFIFNIFLCILFSGKKSWGPSRVLQFSLSSLILFFFFKDLRERGKEKGMSQADSALISQSGMEPKLSWALNQLKPPRHPSLPELLKVTVVFHRLVLLCQFDPHDFAVIFLIPFLLTFRVSLL